MFTHSIPFRFLQAAVAVIYGTMLAAFFAAILVRERKDAAIKS